MRRVVKAVLSALFLLAFVGAAASVMLSPPTREKIESGQAGNAATNHPARDRAFPPFSQGNFETGGFGTAIHFTGPVRDPASIEELRTANATRAARGIADQRAALEAARKTRPVPTPAVFHAEASIALLSMYDGRFDEAARWLRRALDEYPGAPSGLRTNMEALLGVIQLRRGELENCLECRGPSSCILPIDSAAVHQRPSGSRAAIEHFTAYLRERPDDLGVRWLLNLAYMTLGQYPDQVPAQWRLPPGTFQSKTNVGRFRNIASEAGLNIRGPNLAGGSVFDDFNGDGRPDIFTTAFGADLGASYFVNRGDGTFQDQSQSTGLAAQPLALNATHADFDNDGRLDVLLLRGGWENAARLTLLRNTGDGAFEDVTIASGLGEPIASQSAAWGDYDNDGDLDLYVCGEYASANAGGLFASDRDLVLEDPRNLGRLYRNNGDGTFTDVAAKAGAHNKHYAKGAVWGDYDNDGRLDLYVSNFDADNRLFHNNGDGTFTDVAREMGVSGPFVSFPCGFLDFDNDGRLDLFVIDYASNLDEYVRSALGMPTARDCHPRLYRNLGPEGFRDVSKSVGLDRAVVAMGMAIGDIDNDGFQDIYLGTGRPDYSALMPNVLYHNVEGQRFEDVSCSSGTAHLQKGHGSSFADWDDDGDLDLFVEVGGAVPGDRANNLLFDNPGHGRHWLKVHLLGTRSNRSALGARLHVEVVGADGGRRSIFRQIGGTSSFGGTTLTELIGLGETSVVESLTVTWPATGTAHTFHKIAADQTIEITEGAPGYRARKPAPVRRVAVDG